MLVPLIHLLPLTRQCTRKKKGLGILCGFMSYLVLFSRSPAAPSFLPSSLSPCLLRLPHPCLHIDMGIFCHGLRSSSRPWRSLSLCVRVCIFETLSDFSFFFLNFSFVFLFLFGGFRLPCLPPRLFCFDPKSCGASLSRTRLLSLRVRYLSPFYAHSHPLSYYRPSPHVRKLHSDVELRPTPPSSPSLGPVVPCTHTHLPPLGD